MGKEGGKREKGGQDVTNVQVRDNHRPDGGGVQQLNLILSTCSEQLQIATWTTVLRRIMKLRQGSLGKKYLV